MRRALHRSQPLHSARIGKAEGSHISVRPALLGCPLDGVVSVAALVFVRAKFAVGSVAAPHILYDDRVSALDCAAKDRVFLLREVLAIGRARGPETAHLLWAGGCRHGAKLRRAWG